MKNLGFLGEIFRIQTPNQRWLTWPNPTWATKNWPRSKNFDPDPSQCTYASTWFAFYLIDIIESRWGIFAVGNNAKYPQASEKIWSVYLTYVYKATLANHCIALNSSYYFSFTLRYILTSMFNSHYGPAKVILKQAAITVSHYHLFLCFGANILPTSL